MTTADYHAAVEYAQERAADHPLLTVASRGYTPVNCGYLQKVLESIPAIVVEQEKATAEKPKGSDPIARKLYKRKNKLMLERAKMSNAYHEMVSDAARAANSVDLDITQEKIGQVMREIDYYYQHGKLPNEEYSDLPSEPLEVIKKLHHARQSRSRAKRELKMYADDLEGNADKIKVREEALKRNELIIQRIEKYRKVKGI